MIENVFLLSQMLIGIDYPEFNLSIKSTKKRNKTTYGLSVFGLGERRGQKFKSSRPRTVFIPLEPELLKTRVLNLGHPLRRNQN